MTEHPAYAAGCTAAEARVFEQICVGQINGHDPRVVARLAGKGLVHFVEHKGADRHGAYYLREPFVPTMKHYEWCKWCAENADEESVR